MSVNGILEPKQTLTGELASVPYIPERMAHKLTFTGAVEGEYDGSSALNIEIPEKMDESDPTVPAWAKEETKPTYTAQEVGAMPADAVVVKSINGTPPDADGNVDVTGAKGDKGDPGSPGEDGEDGGYYTPSVTRPDDSTLRFRFSPSKSGMASVSAVDVTLPSGGSGGITEETDPTVPAWAKAPEKPSYTAEEVGALPVGTEIPVVPATLPNPYKLTFSGAVNAEYDGSEAVEVVIPQGGGGGEMQLIAEREFTTEDAVSLIEFDNLGEYTEVLMVVRAPWNSAGNCTCTTQYNGVQIEKDWYNFQGSTESFLNVYHVKKTGDFGCEVECYQCRHANSANRLGGGIKCKGFVVAADLGALQKIGFSLSTPLTSNNYNDPVWVKCFAR